MPLSLSFLGSWVVSASHAKVNFCFQKSLFCEWQNGAPHSLLLPFFTYTWGARTRVQKTKRLATRLLLLSDSSPPELGWSLRRYSGGLGHPTSQGTSRTLQCRPIRFSGLLILTWPLLKDASLPLETIDILSSWQPLPPNTPEQVSFFLGMGPPVSSLIPCSLSSLFFNAPILASHRFLSWCQLQLLLYPINLPLGTHF